MVGKEPSANFNLDRSMRTVKEVHFFVYPQCSILLSDTNARTAQSEMQNETLLDDSDL